MAGDRAFTWLVTVLASTPSSPGFLCCFARWLRCATLLYLWLCAHSLLGLGFPRLLASPSPSVRLLVYLFQWVLFSTRVPNLRDGVTPAGSRIVCPRSERRFSVPIWIRYWSVSWMDLAPPSAASLRALSLRVCCQVVLAVSMSFGGTSLSPLSSVLHCPVLGLRVASSTLATGLGLSLIPYPRSFGMGLEPRLEAPLCSLQPLAPSFRVVLAEAARLRRFLNLSIALHWP